MNYSLTISLDGADKAESALDSLLKKMDSIGSGKMPDLMDWAKVGSESEKEGEVAGGKFVKGVSKRLKSFDIMDAWDKAKLKGVQDFWGDAIKNAKFNPLPEVNKGSIKGLRDVTGRDLAKVNSLPDMNDLTPKMDKLKVGVAAIATLFNPFVGARLLSDVIPKDKMSGGKGVTGAIFGAAGAAGYGEIFVVVKILETAFKALVKAINLTLEAYENARKTYSKSLQSGLGIGFTVKRGMLAELLGVGEEEVIKYGAAINYLNQRIAFATDELAKNTMPLTGVGFELKIVGQNIKALWSEIAAGLAPAMQTLISEFNDFLTVLGGTHVLEGIGMVLGIILQMFANITGAIEIIFNTILVGIKTIAAGFALLIVGIINLLAKIPGAGKLGIHAMDGSKITDDLKKSYDDLGNEITNYGKNFLGGKNNVPEPQSYMKQLPASAWEKLGLVIGGGGNSTNDLIRKSNSYLKVIADTVSKTGSGRGAGFGMSPVTANP